MSAPLILDNVINDVILCVASKFDIVTLLLTITDKKRTTSFPLTYDQVKQLHDHLGKVLDNLRD